jgi:hypothetical protein
MDSGKFIDFFGRRLLARNDQSHETAVTLRSLEKLIIGGADPAGIFMVVISYVN